MAERAVQGLAEVGTVAVALDASMEGIASNMLAARLAKLVDAGLPRRDDDPSHRQKVEYHLTEAAIQLTPLIIELGDWGARWLPTTPELAVRAQLRADGGPGLRERFMDELREIHLQRHGVPEHGVIAELTAAYRSAASGA